LPYVAESLGEPDVETRLLESKIDRRVDGLALASMLTHTVAIPEPLREVLLVPLNCVTADVQSPMVIPDERAAGSGASVRSAPPASGHHVGCPVRPGVGDIGHPRVGLFDRA